MNTVIHEALEEWFKLGDEEPCQALSRCDHVAEWRAIHVNPCEHLLYLFCDTHKRSLEEAYSNGYPIRCMTCKHGPIYMAGWERL